MTYDIPTAPLPPEQQNVPKQRKFTPLLDGIRIFALSLFICVFSCFIGYAYMYLSFLLSTYLPGTGMVRSFRDLALFLIFAIPFTAIVYLLAKSLKHFLLYWWIHLIVCGGFCVFIWWLFHLAEGLGFLLPIIVATGFGIALSAELFVLFLRSAVCMVINEIKKGRILSWRFFIGSILVLLFCLIIILFSL